MSIRHANNRSESARFAEYLKGSKNGAIFSARDTLQEALRVAKSAGDKSMVRAAKRWISMANDELEVRYEVNTVSRQASIQC